MTDPVIIERQDLAYIARIAALQVINELSKGSAKTKPWITQNQATKILGRGKLKRAMESGLVRFHKKDPDKKLGRVMVCYEDIKKLINNPKI